MTSTLFYGFGAYVGLIKGLRLVEWWPADPASLGWDAAKRIVTDLGKTPLAVANGGITINQLEADDHVTDLGLTQLGPRYPQGAMVGAIWLAKPFYDSLGNNKPPRHQSSDAHDHELTSILYWNGTTPGKRYYGFHGKILGPGTGNKTKVDVFHGGRGKIPGEQPKSLELDFGAEVDAGNSINTPGQAGPIYIEANKARAVQMTSPKRPEAAGFDFLPWR